MKNGKKGSVLPIVVVGLMMVSVIAFIFLSAALYGDAAYQSSADSLDEKMMLDEIGNRFLHFSEEDSYEACLAVFSRMGEHVGTVPAGNAPYEPKLYNVILSYDKTTLLVKDASMRETLLTVIVGAGKDGDGRRTRVWTYGAYRGQS